MDYNSEIEIEDITVTVGETIDLTFNFYENDVLTDLTGQQLDAHVETSSGTIIKDWSTAGASPKITISTSSYNITDLTPFTSRGRYFYDIKKTDGTDIKVIRKGGFNVLNNIT